MWSDVHLRMSILEHFKLTIQRKRKRKEKKRKKREKEKEKPGMMVHVRNPSNSQAEVEGWQV